MRGAVSEETASLGRGVRLGIDVGKARVGVARSDPDGMIATPVRTLSRDLKKHSDQRVLLQLILEEDVTTVYVGLPKNLSGEHTPSTQDALDYAGELVQALQETGSAAQVRMVDERLSTVSAQRQLHQNGHTTKSSRSIIDQAAAVSILQQALELEHSRKKRAGQALRTTHS
ncbi:Holliday junction resolvase RuvX [Galactobacter caseinivorans]|uniref:Putative pre-16S rRNA nuclease n=1 Tax=Galactobacter caseinivorans TaxID=2676123 RepID=A0A496PL64_9MICC|nr:Holliday junction resolvase RuvX [Galactobacter caseinivorans]